MSVNRTIAAATASPPRSGVKAPARAETRWYATSIGRPSRANMTDHPPAGHQETNDSWRRPPGHGSTGRTRAAETDAARLAPGDGSRGQAAAGPAVGALGRARPGASGSRCEMKPARHDFSRRAATPDLCGAAVAAAATPAPRAGRATSTAADVT